MSDTPFDNLIVAGRYQLGKPIGSGSAGQVFRARDLHTGTRIALKLLHPQLCQVQEVLRRFEREFDATTRIDHPNVVRALNLGEVLDGPFCGTWFLAMELLEGRRLKDVLAGGPLSPARASRIGLDVASALAAAHAAGVVHRDVEPGNVILTRVRGKELARVLDFGVARLQSGSEDTLTDFGVRLGTPEYMAPEYVKSGQLDARSDVYALGVLMYAMLAGNPPFVGRSFTVMQEHARGTPAPPSLRVGGLPDWLESLTLQMLAKDPEHRPTADAVAEQLRAELEALVAEDRDERLARATLNSEIGPPPASVGHHHPAPHPPPPPDRYGWSEAPRFTPQLALLLAGCGIVGFVGSLTVFVLVLGR